MPGWAFFKTISKSLNNCEIERKQMYHVLVLKKDVHKPGHFQYTIYYEGKSFSCPWTQKGFTSNYMHFSSF